MGHTVKHFIAGEFSDGQGQHRLAITNPATQGELAQLTFASTAQIDTAIKAAAEAFKHGEMCQHPSVRD